MTDRDAAAAKVVYVLPTRPAPDDSDPWQLLAEGRAITVEQIERVSGPSSRRGAIYPATSSMARALQPVLDLAESSGGKLFKVQLPTGASIDQLMPAIGGGYRGMVRGAGKGVSGHVRLVPATMTAAKAARMGVVAVAVAADYMAQKELNAKLIAIHRGVSRLNQRLDAEDQAILVVAAETIAEAQAAVAGERTPPASLGLDTTASNLRHFVARERQWVEQLASAATQIEESAAKGKLDVDGVPIDLFEELIGMEGLKAAPWRFAERIGNYYRALVLDSHLAVLATAEAALSKEDVDLDDFQRLLDRRLRVNALRQEELVAATEALARESITSKVLQRKLKEAHAVELVVRTVAFGLQTSPRVPDLVSTTGRQEMIVEVLESGDLKLNA